MLIIMSVGWEHKMKKIIILLLLCILFLFTSCFHKEYFQKTAGFQMLDFRGNYCYYIDRDFFITKFNDKSFLMQVYNDNNDNVIIYEGKFVRFSKINNNYVAVENVYEFDGKEYDEYALIFLPDNYSQLKDVEIERKYNLDDFNKLLNNYNLTIEKWEEG